MWLVWEERKAADFVLEVTSRSTCREDEVGKEGALCAPGGSGVLAVRPVGGVPEPAAEGLRSRRGREVPAGPILRSVAARSVTTACWGRPFGWRTGRLRLHDPMRGEYLLTHAEEREARRLAEVRLAELGAAPARCVRRCRPQSPPATA